MQSALSVPLRVDPSSPTLARSHAVALVAPWASDDFAADTGLLVTELVANAVMHGEAPIHLEIIVHRTFICVEVSDGSFVQPVMRPIGRESASGRGLRLVDAIATSWGTRPRLDGKVVWFELYGHRPATARIPFG